MRNEIVGICSTMQILKRVSCHAEKSQRKHRETVYENRINSIFDHLLVQFI